MLAPDKAPVRSRGPALRRLGIGLAALVFAALVVFALSRLNLKRIGHDLITASPGWVVLAIALMAVSLLLRSVSWHQTLLAALPDTAIAWAPVARATMIGVMASALVPGRLGEPTRVVVLTRRLDGPTGPMLAIVAGTVVSQTLINLLALGVLLAVTFTSVPLAHGHAAGIASALAVPLAVCLLVLFGPRLLALGQRSGWRRVANAANAVGRVLNLARRGLLVFARPRHALAAIASQLLAWALQWLACYVVLLALGLQSQTGLAAAAAILLAVNLSAVLPATPSNVGVFQAACVVVLAAYGVGAGQGLAYGIILQAIEVVTALMLGIPALLKEGLSWQDIRRSGIDSAGESAQ
jgi:phosphatidyl-myo-inositol alpha-mannosyltransferase